MKITKDELVRLVSGIADRMEGEGRASDAFILRMAADGLRNPEPTQEEPIPFAEIGRLAYDLRKSEGLKWRIIAQRLLGPGGNEYSNSERVKHQASNYAVRNGFVWPPAMPGPRKYGLGPTPTMEKNALK